MKNVENFDKNGNDITEDILKYIRKVCAEAYAKGISEGFGAGLEVTDKIRVNKDVFDQYGNDITHVVVEYICSAVVESFREGHEEGFTEGLRAAQDVRRYDPNNDDVDVYTTSCYTGYEPPMPGELDGEV